MKRKTYVRLHMHFDKIIALLMQLQIHNIKRIIPSIKRKPAMPTVDTHQQKPNTKMAQIHNTKQNILQFLTFKL